MNFLAPLDGLQGYKGYSTLQGLHIFKIKLKAYVDEFLKHTSLDYRVTSVTAHYKGCIFLKLE